MPVTCKQQITDGSVWGFGYVANLFSAWDAFTTSTSMSKVPVVEVVRCLFCSCSHTLSGYVLLWVAVRFMRQ